MTRYKKGADGYYHINGKRYKDVIGSRAQVWHGQSFKTSGGLKKGNLFMNKSNRIVSKSKHNTAKREKRLVKAGYGAKKGKFGYVLLNKSATAKRQKKRGGSGMKPSGEPIAIASKPAIA
jgi:hypothetical protein